MMTCDECGGDNITEDLWRNKPRYTCRCGHVWKEGESQLDSTCSFCGTYQHPAAYKKYWTRVLGCWYCGKKRQDNEVIPL